MVQRELLAKRINLKEERIEVKKIIACVFLGYIHMLTFLNRFGSRTGEQNGENSKEKQKILLIDEKSKEFYLVNTIFKLVKIFNMLIF